MDECKPLPGASTPTPFPPALLATLAALPAPGASAFLSAAWVQGTTTWQGQRQHSERAVL